MTRSSKLIEDLMASLSPGTDWPGEAYYSEWKCSCGYSKWFMCGGIIGHPGVPCPKCSGKLEETKSTRRMPMQLVELRESILRKQIEVLSTALDSDAERLCPLSDGWRCFHVDTPLGPQLRAERESPGGEER